MTAEIAADIAKTEATLRADATEAKAAAARVQQTVAADVKAGEHAATAVFDAATATEGAIHAELDRLYRETQRLHHALIDRFDYIVEDVEHEADAVASAGLGWWMAGALLVGAGGWWMFGHTVIEAIHTLAR